MMNAKQVFLGLFMIQLKVLITVPEKVLSKCILP